jgi:hypothetical protein
MKRSDLLRAMRLPAEEAAFALRDFPGAAAVETGQGLMAPYSSYQFAVEVHKVRMQRRVLAFRHKAGRGTAASLVEEVVGTAAALVALMAHILVVAGLYKSFQHQLSCLAHVNVLKGRVQRIDEVVGDYIRPSFAGCMPLTADLRASDHNIEQR